MNAGALESPLQLQKLIGAVVIALAAVFIGYFLVGNPTMLVLFALGIGWLMLLPYHSAISVYLSVATFGSAIILPYFPGRPFLWEFAALLGWSGMLVSISMRRYSDDFGAQLQRERLLFLGLTGYCFVLLITMFYRGFGLRIFGGDQMGGRFYFQQLSCAIFPFLFASFRMKEGTLVRLFLVQCALGATYVLSDLVLSYGPGQLFVLLQFFELPGDALNFEYQADNFGLRRFQSLMALSQGSIFIVLVLFSLRSFTNRRAVILLPVAILAVAVGLFSGHRYHLMILAFTIYFCMYGQKFFNLRSILITVGVGVVLLLFVYGFSLKMPLAAQRALSVLPGIEIDGQARYDGVGTLEMRRILRQIGWSMVPDYLWIGRGFGMSGSGGTMDTWDPTLITRHVNQGRFYNGFVGLMVNTGIFGTASLLLFIGAGSFLALRIMRILRMDGCDDNFARSCCVIAAFWMANVISFLFFHGDSEFTLRIFSLHAGLLLVCHRLLRERGTRRLQERSTA